MSLFGISDTQLEKLAYPNGRGVYHYGNTPVNINQTAQTYQGVQPGGVSSIGTTPVESGVVATTDPALGVTAGQLPATGVPAGAAAGPAAAAGGGFGSIASGAISQIGQVAADYMKAKGQADALKAQKGVPNVPGDTGVAGTFQPPALAF